MSEVTKDFPFGVDTVYVVVRWVGEQRTFVSVVGVYVNSDDALRQLDDDDPCTRVIKAPLQQ